MNTYKKIFSFSLVIFITAGVIGLFTLFSDASTSIVGSVPFASEEEFSKHFTLNTGDSFSDGVITLGTSNLFSESVIDVNRYTISVKGTVGDYKAGDIVEICVNIGDAKNHHRFMIKDIGSERNNIPRNAFTKYVKLVNGVTQSPTNDKALNKQFITGTWFEIRIEVDGNKAEMYVDDVLCQSISIEEKSGVTLGLRGKGVKFKDLSVISKELPPIPSIIGSDPFASESEFLKYFTLNEGDSFNENVLTLGSKNLFSKVNIDTSKYTVFVKATPGDYKAGDIVEMCVNLGNETNHHRFMIKDIGNERNNIPRNAFAKYIKIVDGATQLPTDDKALDMKFIAGSWLDIVIVIDGTKADFYVDGVLRESIVSSEEIAGALGLRGKNTRFKELYVKEGLQPPEKKDGLTIIGTDPFSSETEFAKFFELNSGDSFVNKILTLGNSNIFSKGDIGLNSYTVSVQAIVKDYKAGDIVEICINIGNGLEHHRFMVKDTGAERSNVPRNAFTRYGKVVNGTFDNQSASSEKALNTIFSQDEWFDIEIVVDEKIAYMYVNGTLCQTIESEEGFNGKVGLRGKGASFRNLTVLDSVKNPETSDTYSPLGILAVMLLMVLLRKKYRVM